MIQLRQKLNKIFEFLSLILSVTINVKALYGILLATAVTCLVLLTINSFMIIEALYKIVECLEKIAGKF